MGNVTSISLTDHFEAFIDEQTAEGRYESRSAVIQAALRLLEEREDRLRLLRRAIAEGDASGPAMPLDFQALYEEIDGLETRSLSQQ